MASDEDVSERRLCLECIREKHLAQQLAEDADDDEECDYCGEVGNTVLIDDVATKIAEAIDRLYYRTSPEPEGLDLLAAKEGLWERDGEPVEHLIADLARIDAEPAEDIRTLLEDRNRNFDPDFVGEENPFDEDAHYDEKPTSGDSFQTEWDRFQYALKTETRFFSRTARATLDSIFGHVASLRTASGSSVVVAAGPNTSYAELFRARAFQSDRNLLEALKHPHREIGPPPSRVAGAGRMNAIGISIFYGASSPECALAEVRPPVGSKVVVGRFAIERELRLLDVEAMSSVRVDGSPFDPEYVLRLEHAAFLRRLSSRISQPVMPDDEPLDYLITQAVADYLATEVTPALDGIIYPAVQAGAGQNVALFHKAARIEFVETPSGTRIDARFSALSEDDDLEYSVTEEIPTPRPNAMVGPSSKVEFADLLEQSAYRPADARQVTLRLDVNSLRVHQVARVSFEAPSVPVRRTRLDERNLSVELDATSKRTRESADPFTDDV